MKLKKRDDRRYIGVDVSKATLDIDDSCGAIPKRVDNDEKAIAKHLVSQINGPEQTLVVCEGTGGYERKLVAAMHSAAIPVVVAHPRQVRDFASGHGILEKSDPIDASVIRCFGEDVRNLKLATAKSDEQESHSAMARRRKQLVDMINQEKNRLAQIPRSSAIFPNWESYPEAKWQSLWALRRWFVNRSSTKASE